RHEPFDPGDRTDSIGGAMKGFYYKLKPVSPGIRFLARCGDSRARGSSLMVAVLLAAGSLLGQTAMPTATPPATGGSIAGTLSDSNGLPGAGAYVTGLRALLSAASGGAGAGANGAFLVSGLPAGTYAMCVQLAGSALLDPCEWEAKPVTATVVGGQPTRGFQLAVKRGAVIPIRLNDTQGLLETPSSTGAKPDV